MYSRMHYMYVVHNDYIRVIPNQFSKSLQVTPSELDETWFVSTTCGFMKPDKILLSYVVWLPDYSPSKIQLYPNFCWYSNYSNPHNFLILDCFVISIAPSGSMKNGLSYGILYGFIRQSLGETHIPKL